MAHLICLLPNLLSYGTININRHQLCQRSNIFNCFLSIAKLKKKQPLPSADVDVVSLFPFCVRFFPFFSLLFFIPSIPGRDMVLGGTRTIITVTQCNRVLTSFLCFFFTCSRQASAPAQGRFFFFFFYQHEVFLLVHKT